MDCKFEEDMCEMKKLATMAMVLIMCVWDYLPGVVLLMQQMKAQFLYLRMDKLFPQM